MNALTGLSKYLTGVAAHEELPTGEALGATFDLGGKTYYVTQAEVDRVSNLPSAEEITALVAYVNRLMAWQPVQPQCPCETTGRTTAACPAHGPADTQAPPAPKGWE